MNCFTSLGNVLFTFHVQGCSALVIVVVVVVGTLVVVLASFQHDNTSTSPNISGTDSACQPTKQPVRQTDKQTDGPSASGTQLPSCWVLFGFWAIKFVVLQLSVNVHTPTHTHTHTQPKCSPMCWLFLQLQRYNSTQSICDCRSNEAFQMLCNGLISSYIKEICSWFRKKVANDPFKSCIPQPHHSNQCMHNVVLQSSTLCRNNRIFCIQFANTL